MSGTSSSDDEKSMEQSNNDLCEVMGQLSVTTDNSEKSSRCLSDMPVDVVGLVIDRSDYKEQLKLRKVTKSLRALVDDRKPACKSIKVEWCTKIVYITFNGHTVIYSKNANNGFNVHAETIIVRDDFKKVAFDDLAATLNNPRLRLEEFSVTNNYEKKDIRNVMDSLNHQVSVKEINIRILSHSCLFSVLPFLKPGVLKKISIFFNLGELDWRILARMEQVALLEQWKQAEELELHNALDEFPMEYATHFKRFLICDNVFNGGSIDRIKDFLSKSNNFGKGTLRSLSFDLGPYLVYQLLGQPVSSSTTEEVFHYSIPNSDNYLEIKKATGSSELEITKKKREANR